MGHGLRPDEQEPAHHQPARGQQSGHSSHRSVGRGHVPNVVVKRRSRRLLETTNTELNAMAAPAIIGLSSPAAAKGIAATLYANAQNRLPLMVLSVRRDSRIASAAARRSPRTSVRSPASMATSVPVPMA